MVASYTLGHVRIVTDSGILENQLISGADGVIEAVKPHSTGVSAEIDGCGMLCLPGIVDLQSNALARECRPRPGVRHP